ncbi:diguanylate cyclase [Pseudomonas sp. CFBP 13711]|nr:diguanylate cyclase [Pseudomonas sp. CFBP 13711]MBD8715601.1 diguanylate cyclase [Pseudomonas sp. CFBP 13715]
MVLYLYLNGFKGINDRCGHATGDEAITLFFKRIEKQSHDY